MNKKKLIAAISSVVLISAACCYQINKKNTPLVSVVIPTYNRAHLLPRALDSLLQQTMQDFEIIIVDDASSDKTKVLLEAYQKTTDKIKVFYHKENQGVSGARNTAHQKAKGKYIAIMDSDDYATPEWLAEAIAHMEENPQIDVLVPLKKEIYDDAPTEERTVYPPIHKFYQDNYLSNVGNIIKRSFITKHKIEYSSNFICGEDYDFWIQMIKKGARLEKLDKPLVVVRKHKTNGNTYNNACHQARVNITDSFISSLGLPLSIKENECAVTKKILEIYPNIFNNLDKFYMLDEVCPIRGENAIFVIHKKWRNYLVISDDLKTIYQYRNPNNSGEIVEFIPEKHLIINWEKWGKESFVYNPENQFYRYTEQE